MKRMFRRGALFLSLAGLFLSASPAAAPAAPGTVKGRVVDADGLPLKDAVVSLIDQSGGRTYTIITDERGNFRRTDIPAGDYTLKFEKAGYKSLAGTVSVLARKDNVFDATLMPEVRKPEKPAWEDRRAQARDLYAQKKYKEALEIYQAILAGNPDEAGIRFNAGNCYYRLQDYEAALREFKEAVRLKPDFFEAYINLANMSGLLKRSAEAIPVLEEAIRSYPENGQLYSSLGLLCLDAGQFAKAARSLERAAASDPAKPLIRRALGSAYAGAGDVPRAVASYEKYIGLISDPQEIERVRAVIEQLKKK